MKREGRQPAKKKGNKIPGLALFAFHNNRSPRPPHVWPTPLGLPLTRHQDDHRAADRPEVQPHPPLQPDDRRPLPPPEVPRDLPPPPLLPLLLPLHPPRAPQIWGPRVQGGIGASGEWCGGLAQQRRRLFLGEAALRRMAIPYDFNDSDWEAWPTPQ